MPSGSSTSETARRSTTEALGAGARCRQPAAAPGGKALQLEQLIAAAPDVPVTIAHLWGGANYPASALAFYADAVSSNDRRMASVWFDVTDIMSAIRGSPSDMAEVVRRMRQIGIARLLWGSDTSPPGPMPHVAWQEFRALPLTEGEFAAIAANVAPYMP